MGLRVDREDPRNAVGLSDIINELRGRNDLPNEVRAMIEVVGEDFQRLWQHLGSLAAMQTRAANNLPTIGVGAQTATLHPHSTSGRPGVQAGSGSPGTSRSLAGMQARPANDLATIGVGTQTTTPHPLSTGGHPGVQVGPGSPGSSQNPFIIGDSPRLSANSGGAPLPEAVHGGTRIPKSTIYCGVFKPVPNIPRAPRYRQDIDRSMWRFRCILCKEVYRDHKSVYHHFARCVGTCGNPNANRWFDDPSIDVSKIPESLLRPLNR